MKNLTRFEPNLSSELTQAKRHAGYPRLARLAMPRLTAFIFLRNPIFADKFLIHNLHTNKQNLWNETFSKNTAWSRQTLPRVHIRRTSRVRRIYMKIKINPDNRDAR